MKLLYIPSGHPLQEADDCLMWEYLGINWFSTGTYAYNDKPGDLPFIKKILNRDRLYFLDGIEEARNSDDDNTLCGQKNKTWTGLNIKNLFKFNRDYIKKFDVIVISHFIDNYFNNIEAFKDKLVIFKSFGMHAIKDEEKIRLAKNNGVIIIRNSPAEVSGNNKIYDYIIRGCPLLKDEDCIWNGNTNKVVTFCSFFDIDKRRKRFYYSVVNDKHVTEIVNIEKKKRKIPKIEFELYGVKSGKFLSDQEKLEKLQNYRVNLVIGTPNANNTYSFVEAFYMGQPIVCFGPRLWRTEVLEPVSLIKNNVNGFIHNSHKECAKSIINLMKDKDMATAISQQARKDALKIYSRSVLAEQWKEVFKWKKS